MANGDLNWIANFIWGIADDVLRDVYVRGKYRDVILPMVVIRRLDAVLEPTKQAVLDMKANLDNAGITNQDAALRQAAGQAFYNSSPFTLRDLRARSRTQQLRSDFEAFLDGFSPNIQDILEKFQFRHQVPRLVEADVLAILFEKFLDYSINLGPTDVLTGDGTVRLPALDNHGMGTIFEELIRRFNEENNEEAGEHFTPRDVVRLMADLALKPIADQIESATYLLYDGACGTGGMLTVAEERLLELAKQQGKDVSSTYLGRKSTRKPTPSLRRTYCSKEKGRKGRTSIWVRLSRKTTLRLGNLTSCCQIHPTEKVGKPTLIAWAAKARCATQGT